MATMVAAGRPLLISPRARGAAESLPPCRSRSAVGVAPWRPLPRWPGQLARSAPSRLSSPCLLYTSPSPRD
eukprot:5509350-Alexandrium_andersonii.AAC.1